MNRFLCIPFCLITIALTGFGFQTDYSDKLLTESKQYLLGLKDFSAKFSYSLESAQSRKIAYDGVLSYMRGKYTLKMKDHDIYFDGKRHTIYMAQLNQYQKLDQNPTQSVGLVQYMTYVYSWPSNKKYMGEEMLNDVSHHKVELDMTDPKLPYKRAILWMDKESKLIVKVSFINTKKTVTTYEFHEIDINAGLSESDFIFDPKKYGATEFDED